MPGLGDPILALSQVEGRRVWLLLLDAWAGPGGTSPVFGTELDRTSDRLRFHRLGSQGLVIRLLLSVRFLFLRILRLRRGLGDRRCGNGSSAAACFRVPLLHLLGDQLLVRLLRLRLAGKLLGVPLAIRADAAEVDRVALAVQFDGPELLRGTLDELKLAATHDGLPGAVPRWAGRLRSSTGNEWICTKQN